MDGLDLENGNAPTLAMHPDGGVNVYRNSSGFLKVQGFEFTGSSAARSSSWKRGW